MRIHISLEDDLVEELDGRVGRGRRSAFIASLIRRALDDERRRAGRWRRDSAERGTTLHQADCLIAAAAVSVGA